LFHIIEILFLDNYTGNSNKVEDSVQSLPATSTLSEQPSYKETPKTDWTRPARAPAG